MKTLKPLKVSDNKRFLMTEDGAPFFWLGDTAWELFHRLNKEEADLYLENRAAKGFNVIQAVALAEFDGVRTPNAYGRFPLLKNEGGTYDPGRLDVSHGENGYSYWDHVDYVVEKARALGLYVALLPTWGDKFNCEFGQGPMIFDAQNAYLYAKALAVRYAGAENLIWVLGGDRELLTQHHFEVIYGMARGIQEVSQGRQLITFHPAGNASSSKHLHQAEWLDFNMIQSGHLEEFIDQKKYMERDYGLEPVKPVLDAESRYEDHPMAFTGNNTMFDAFISRVAAYGSVFEGGCGYTYGHHAIWCFKREDERGNYFANNWRAALDRPGAAQMQHLKNLILSKPYFERVPAPELLADRYERAGKLYATRGENYVMVYNPFGLRVTLVNNALPWNSVRASYFSPRTGEYSDLGILKNEDEMSFLPPVSGRGEDVVLILEKA